MLNKQPLRIKTISEYHKLMGLPKPEHPLISLVNLDDITKLPLEKSFSIVFDFYSISLKRYSNIKYKYGQQSNDFDEGILFFMSPNQVMAINIENADSAKTEGLILYVHPDFLYGSSLAKDIKRYEFFSYSVSEALFLSSKEEDIITGILKNIQREYHANIDDFSQDVIVRQLDLLLTYADRYYHRQFLTRKNTNHKILNNLEEALNEMFEEVRLAENGIPSVQYISDKLNISTSYLSRLLKTLTGQSTQHHIQNRVIEKAKEKLSATTLSVSEIAYELGFEHPQSFSKLFKTKTNISPLGFRASFN
ncbi:helix-turn-helix domain-containing protein [Mucilaginibacter sp.]|uniref:helix-turn-helix domain-containing protein n=1 Tax=Mucilaginibacter sp. TaxID=1882438 RepID=UPI003AFFF01F